MEKRYNKLTIAESRVRYELRKHFFSIHNNCNFGGLRMENVSRSTVAEWHSYIMKMA